MERLVDGPSARDCWTWPTRRSTTARPADGGDNAEGPGALAYPDRPLDEVLARIAERSRPGSSRRRRRLGPLRCELEEYFKGERQRFDHPIDWSLTRGFFRAVLKATARIRYGTGAQLRRGRRERGQPEGGEGGRQRPWLEPDPGGGALPSRRAQRRGYRRLHGWDRAQGVPPRSRAPLSRLAELGDRDRFEQGLAALRVQQPGSSARSTSWSPSSSTRRRPRSGRADTTSASSSASNRSPTPSSTAKPPGIPPRRGPGIRRAAEGRCRRAPRSCREQAQPGAGPGAPRLRVMAASNQHIQPALTPTAPRPSATPPPAASPPRGAARGRARLIMLPPPT